MIALALMLAAGATLKSTSIDLKRPAPDAPFTVVSIITGGAPLEWAGSQMAGGDINGDGLDDLVIAAPGGSEDRPSRRGRLYIIYGSVQPRPAIDLAPPRAGALDPARGADVVINGAHDFDHLGRALAVADFNGDGLADIAAGAPRADGPLGGRPDCGEITIIFGSTTLPRAIELAALPEAVRVMTVVGAAAGDTLGASLAAGDLSGDGIADLIAGAPLADGAAGGLGALDTGAAVALVMSRTPPALVDLSWTVLPIPAALWSGRDAGDQAGSAVAVGDFDGDAVNDIAVGARAADGPGNMRPDAGEVYLMLGPDIPGGVLDDVAYAQVTGPDVGDLLGSSLLLADLDGDRRADLIAGAEGADGVSNFRLDAGEAWIVPGRPRAQLLALRPAPPPEPAASSVQQRLRAAEPGRGGPHGGPIPLRLGSDDAVKAQSIAAPDPGDHLNVRAAGDLQGDGRMELILGAEDAASRRNARAGGGEARVRLADGTLLEIFAPTGGAHLGRAACALDWDGDGARELALAAPQAGRAASGRIWVLKLKVLP